MIQDLMDVEKKSFIYSKNSVYFSQNNSKHEIDVENVLLVIGVDRKETYGLLSPEYYHTIVERAKVF